MRAAESSAAAGRRALFVTGTDTGVGKTTIAVALLTWLNGRAIRARGLKPIASGAIRTPEGLRNADAVALRAASAAPAPYPLVNPYCFEAAVAPHLAARDAGVEIPLADLLEWYVKATAGVEYTIVEGAGGWRVPLHPSGFLSDLPEALGLPVLLVVGLRLGCLNHARLTYEAVERGGRCRVAGWIANTIDPAFERPVENLEALEQLLGIAPLAVVPFMTAANTAEIARRFDAAALGTALLAGSGILTFPGEG